MSGAKSFRAGKYFITERKRGPAADKTLVVVRDPTAEFTGTKWFRQEFIITLEMGYWPSDMIVLDKEDDRLYIVRGNEYMSGDYGPQQILPLPYSVSDLPYRQARRVAMYAR